MLGWHRAGVLGAVLLLAISLAVPALLNRQPILYSDSIGYFHAGYAAIERLMPRLPAKAGTHAVTTAQPNLAQQEQDGISTARSVYYGIPYVIAFLAGGNWGAIAIQILLTLTCLLLAARRALPAGPWLMWGSLFAISLLSGLSSFADTLMPDVFAGLMLLGSGMLLAYGPRMRFWEYGFWLCIVLLACLFHKSHLLILILVLAAAGLLLWRKNAKVLIQLSVIAILALAGHTAVDAVVQRLTGKPPVSTPFLLARLIGDGTAGKYLSQACPEKRYVTCNYLPRLPMSENEFLWSRDPVKSAFGSADRETRAAIAAESGEIVRETLWRYPAEQLFASARGAVLQFITVGVSEFRLVPTGPESIAVLRPAVENYRGSTIANPASPLLGVISATMLIAYAIGIAASTWLVLRAAAGPARRLAAILLLGIVFNAIVCGSISGVFDRYQGRVAWLAVLALAVLIANSIHHRPAGPHPN